MSKEPSIRAELYRALTNAISNMFGLAIYGRLAKGHKISRVEVEYPVGDKKADLVVFKQIQEGKANFPFFVIETKGRRINPALTLARATKQAMNYTRQLNSDFFAVYDGWNFLLFEMKYPYLIKLSNFLNVDIYIARNLLSGLLEFERDGRNAISLTKLPKVADGWSFQRTIMPSVARELASRPEPKDSWKVLLEKWAPIIKEDGNW